MGFKDEEYIMIPGWMINQLKLKGNDLLVYAVIYRYSQDGIHRFYGSLQYLADWANSSVSGIQNNIKNLVESNLVFKNKSGDSINSRCEYWVNLSALQQNCKDIQQSCTNNTIKNRLFISKDINNRDTELLEKNSYFNNHRTSKSFKVLQTWLSLYVEEEKLRNSLSNWLSIMYSNKKISNLEGLKNKVDYLFEASTSPDERIAIVQDATDKLWFTFQYSVDRVRKSNYNRIQNIQGDIPLERKVETLDLSDEVF